MVDIGGMESVSESVEARLKMELWRRFGSAQYPAEWDGANYGGGKLSQRYWEYLKAVELLDLGPDSVVLDIGGGSRKTGIGFFSGLIQPYVRKVIIVDAAIAGDVQAPENVVFIREFIGPDELKRILDLNLNITHIVSLSVFEHIDDDLRQGMIEVINSYFNGTAFVSTFEYNARKCHFDMQLTARSVAELFQPLTNFYLSRFESSPVPCENAFGESENPRWYPVAVKFEQMGAGY